MTNCFYDMEVYPNWNCIRFKVGDKVKAFDFIEMIDDETRDYIVKIIKKYTRVGFNIFGYDDVILDALLSGYRPHQVHALSKRIIEDNEPSWRIRRETTDIKEWTKEGDAIDIMKVLPLQAPMKLYGARVHFKKLQELPVDPHRDLTEAQQKIVGDYCVNDVEVTETLFNAYKHEFELRQTMSAEYGIDLRSMGGAKIAETVLTDTCNTANGTVAKRPKLGKDIPYSTKYKKPHWIKFKTKVYQDLLEEIEADVFEINPDTGHLILGDSVKGRIVRSVDSSIKLGIGGVHGKLGEGARFSNETHVIVESDWQSLYPNLIVNSNSYPEHLSEIFLEVYKEILASRIKAKVAGRTNEANSKKLILNSSFGKFGEKFSTLYSPNLVLNTTLSGQLTLLMFVEKLELADFQIFTCNTDSVTSIIERKRIDEYKKLCTEFDKEVNLTLEHDFYDFYIAKSVNSYFAKYEGSDKIKKKGEFVSGYNDLSHNPSANVIRESVINYFATGQSVEDYIYKWSDIRDFVSVVTVKGGAYYDNNPIGKIARFYYSTESKGSINYIKTGNKVPMSDGAKPLMDLPDELPIDIDYEVYIEMANEVIADVGRETKPDRNRSLFELQKKGLSIVPFPHKGVTISEDGADFSAIDSLGCQTGYRAGLIAMRYQSEDSELYTLFSFDDKTYPSALKSVEKKTGWDLKYGGAISIDEVNLSVPIEPIPKWLEFGIYENLGKPAKRKICGGIDMEWMI